MASRRAAPISIPAAAAAVVKVCESPVVWVRKLRLRASVKLVPCMVTALTSPDYNSGEGRDSAVAKPAPTATKAIDREKGEIAASLG
jgi:hypothetical protein